VQPGPKFARRGLTSHRGDPSPGNVPGAIPGGLSAGAYALGHEASTLGQPYGPGISVGGGNFGMRIADMVTGVKLYALTALDLCNQEHQ